MADLFTAESAIALFTLTVLEVVLGVDNVVFLAIVTQHVPKAQQALARKAGLSLALLGRVVMVFGMSLLLGLEKGLFSLAGHEFSAKDLILLVGGLFLVYKAVTEIYKVTELKEHSEEAPAKSVAGSMAGVIAQIALVDMIFAIDSVLTAVGMTTGLPSAEIAFGITSGVALIIIAMTIAIAVMMFYAGPLTDFIEKHPSLKMLALSFLVLVGVLLLSDAFGEEINRNYVYFAIIFSLGVEGLNFRRQNNLTRQQAEKGPVGV